MSIGAERPITKPVLRAIAEYARFKLISSAHELGERGGVKAYQTHGPVYVALATLGYGGSELVKMLGGNPVAFARERLRVDFGDHGAAVFDFWFSHQALVSILNSLLNEDTSETALADHDYESSRTIILDPLRSAIDSLGVSPELMEGLDAAERCLRKTRPAPAELAAVRDQIAGAYADSARRVLGLEEVLTVGQVPHVGISYATAYRLALLAGAARAEWTFQVAPRLDEDADPNTKRYALRAAVDALRVQKTIPTYGLRRVRKAFDRLMDVQGRLGTADWDRIWSWLTNVFGIWIGSLADHVYALSTDLDMLERALSYENGEPLAVEAVARLAEPLRILGGDLLAERAHHLEVRLGGDRARVPPLRDECLALARDTRRWVTDTVLTDGESPSDAGALVRRFSSYWVPVDEERVGAFLRQFPPTLRWVGEGLLEAVEFFDEAYFSRVLSHLIVEASGQGASLCLLGGPRKSTSLMSYILDRSLPGRYVDLRSTLTKGATGPLTFVDDCLLSGTQAEHMISELLAPRGKGKRPVKYYEPLTKTERQRLRGRPLKFVFGVGTDAGRARFRRFLDQSGLQHDVLIGREVALLSERGRAAREEGRLLDASGSVRDPVASLAAPLFSPFERVWPRGRRWEDAREFCQRVGYAILDRRAAAAGWSNERRHGSALGFSGFQGRLVFGHNVPKTTLTLLWEHGVFEGRAWVPLFPSRE